MWEKSCIFAHGKIRPMKKHILAFAAFGMLTFSVMAQTLTFDDVSMKYGYKNANGVWQIPPRYQVAFAFQHLDRKFAVVKYDGRWGCIDDAGNMIVRNIFNTQEEAQLAGDHWYSAEEPGKWIYPARNPSDGKWGFVNYYGQWKYEPEYEGAGLYVGEDPMSFAPVKKAGRWGCIDSKGILIINNIFFTEEDATEAGRQWIVGRHYDTWRMAVTNERGRWGAVNYLGRWVVQPRYQMVRQFPMEHNYIYTQAKSRGRWGNIDRNGNIISDFIFSKEKDCVYALSQIEHGRPLDDWRLPEMRTDSNADGTYPWGWVRADGSWAIQPLYLEVSHFANDTGLFATAKCDNGLWASIDNMGNLLSKPIFVLSSEAAKAGREWDLNLQDVEDAELGHWLHPIKEEGSGHWGYVDFEGNWVIQPRFEDAKPFIFKWNNRVAPVKEAGKWGCIDHTGQFVVKPIYNNSADAYVAARQWGTKKKF